MEIKIGKGIGAVRFGMQEKKVLELLGPADELDVSEEIDGTVTRTLEYYDLGLSFSFDSDDGDKLSSIALSDKDRDFHGLRIGINKEEVLTIASNTDWGEPEYDDLSYDDAFSLEVIMYDKISLSVWLEDNEVTEIEFGPIWADEDTIIWPDLNMN